MALNRSPGEEERVEFPSRLLDGDGPAAELLQRYGRARPGPNVPQAWDRLLPRVLRADCGTRLFLSLAFGGLGVLAGAGAVVLSLARSAPPEPAPESAPSPNPTASEAQTTTRAPVLLDDRARRLPEGDHDSGAASARISPGAVARGRSSRRGLEIELDRGQLALAVPAADCPVDVLVGAYRFTVRGASFVIERSGQDLRLAVEEGRVAITPARPRERHESSASFRPAGAGPLHARGESLSPRRWRPTSSRERTISGAIPRALSGPSATSGAASPAGSSAPRWTCRLSTSCPAWAAGRRLWARARASCRRSRREFGPPSCTSCAATSTATAFVIPGGRCRSTSPRARARAWRGPRRLPRRRRPRAARSRGRGETGVPRLPRSIVAPACRRGPVAPRTAGGPAMNPMSSSRSSSTRFRTDGRCVMNRRIQSSFRLPLVLAGFLLALLGAVACDPKPIGALGDPQSSAAMSTGNTQPNGVSPAPAPVPVPTPSPAPPTPPGQGVPNDPPSLRPRRRPGPRLRRRPRLHPAPTVHRGRPPRRRSPPRPARIAISRCSRFT